MGDGSRFRPRGGLRRRLGILAQRLLETRMLHFQPAQAVTTRPQVKPLRPHAHPRGRCDVRVLQFICVLIHEREAVLREPAARSEQHPFVLRALGQQAFDQLQAERNRRLHQLRIVIRGKPRPAAGQRIAQLVDRHLLDGATAQQHEQQRKPAPGRKSALMGAFCGNRLHRADVLADRQKGASLQP